MKDGRNEGIGALALSVARVDDAPDGLPTGGWTEAGTGAGAGGAGGGGLAVVVGDAADGLLTDGSVGVRGREAGDAPGDGDGDGDGDSDGDGDGDGDGAAAIAPFKRFKPCAGIAPGVLGVGLDRLNGIRALFKFVVGADSETSGVTGAGGGSTPALTSVESVFSCIATPISMTAIPEPGATVRL